MGINHCHTYILFKFITYISNLVYVIVYFDKKEILKINSLMFLILSSHTIINAISKVIIGLNDTQINM